MAIAQEDLALCDMALAHLASQPEAAQEPVAWISKGGLATLKLGIRTDVFPEKDSECLNTIPLYTRPAAQEGWRMVPIEPTAGMIDAACNWREQLQTIDKPSMRDQYRAFYAAMLASAPQPKGVP